MNKLRYFRELKGLTQDKLAELANTSQPQVARLEKEPGDKNYRALSVHWAQKLAPHLGVRAIDLLPLAPSERSAVRIPNVNEKDTDRSYPDRVGSLTPPQEGKVVDPEAFYSAIGRLAVELEGLKEQFKELKDGKPLTHPKKAQRR